MNFVCFVLVMFAAVDASAATGLLERPCEDRFASVIAMPDLHAYFGRPPSTPDAGSGVVERRVFDYKNNREPLPGRRIYLSRLTTPVDGPGLDSPALDLTWDVPKAYGALVASLRRGDFIQVAEHRRLRLGEYLGWDGEAQFFRIDERPGWILWLPFVPNAFRRTPPGVRIEDGLILIEDAVFIVGLGHRSVGSEVR